MKPLDLNFCDFEYEMTPHATFATRSCVPNSDFQRLILESVASTGKTTGYIDRQTRQIDKASL